jgi:hypothetical protein
MSLLKTILVICSIQNLLATHLLIDFVTEGYLYAKLSNLPTSDQKPSSTNSQPTETLDFKGNHYNFLTPEGERILHVSGSRLAKANKQIFHQIKAHKEVDIYAQSLRKSVVAGMQAYILGALGFSSGKSVYNTRHDYFVPPFENDNTNFDRKDLLVPSLTKFGLKDGLPTFKYKDFGWESERFLDRKSDAEFYYLLSGCPGLLAKQVEDSLRDAANGVSKWTDDDGSTVEWRLPSKGVLAAHIKDWAKVKIYDMRLHAKLTGDWHQQHSNNFEVPALIPGWTPHLTKLGSSGEPLNYIHWFEALMYKTVHGPETINWPSESTLAKP